MPTSVFCHPELQQSEYLKGLLQDLGTVSVADSFDASAVCTATPRRPTVPGVCGCLHVTRLPAKAVKSFYLGRDPLPLHDVSLIFGDGVQGGSEQPDNGRVVAVSRVGVSGDGFDARCSGGSNANGGVISIGS